MSTETNLSSITVEQLVEFGMTTTTEPFPGVSMTKVIGDGSAGQLSISVVHYRNAPEIALVMPGGHMIYLNVGSIEDLKKFESMLYEFEPNF